MRRLILLTFSLFSFGVLFSQSEKEKAQIAESTMRSGDFVKAISLYQDLIKVNPKNYVYHLNLGWSKLNASSFTKGEEELNQALKLNDGCARCFIGLSILRFQKQELNEAIGLADKAIVLDDTASFSYFIRGQIYEAAGKNFKANLDYDKAIEMNSNMPDYYYARGSFRFRREEYASALKDFDAAIQLDNSQSDFYFQRGYTKYMLKRLEEAEKDIYKALEIDSTSSDYWLGLGAIQDEAGKTDDALEAYAMTIKYNPTNAMAFYNRGNIFYNRGELDKSCIEFYQSSYALYRTNKLNGGIADELRGMLSNHCDTNSASFYYQRGLLYYEAGELEIALRVLELGVKKWPYHPILNTFKGNTYLMAHEFDKAEAAYTMALSKTEEIPDDILNSYVLNMNKGVPEEYMKIHYINTYEGKAKAKLGQIKFEGALSDIEKALFLSQKQAEPDDELLNVQKASILACLGKDKEALDLIEKLIIKNPNLAEAYVVRARISLKSALDEKNRRAKFSYASAEESGLFYLQADNIKLGKLDKLMYESALQDCRTAIAINNSLSEAWFLMAQIKYYGKDSDNCTELLKARQLGIIDAIKLIPNNNCVDKLIESN